MSAQSRVTSRCDVADFGRENLHQFLPIYCEGMLSLVVLWLCGQYIDIITIWRFTVRFYCVSGWHGRPVGVCYHVYGSLWTAKIIQNNKLIITREAGLTPREPSIMVFRVNTRVCYRLIFYLSCKASINIMNKISMFSNYYLSIYKMGVGAFS